MSYQVYQLGGQTNGAFVPSVPGGVGGQTTQYKVAYVASPSVQTTQPSSYPMIVDLSQMYKNTSGCQVPTSGPAPAPAPTPQYVRMRKNFCCPGCAPCCCGECDKEVVITEEEAIKAEEEDCCDTCCGGCCGPEGCCSPQGNCCSPNGACNGCCSPIGCCGSEGNCCNEGGACGGCCAPKGCCGPEGNCCHPNGACNGCCSTEKCCGGCCNQQIKPEVEPPPQPPVTSAPVSCGYVPIQLQPKQIAMPCAVNNGFQVAGMTPIQAIPVDRKFVWSGSSIQPYANAARVVYNA